MNTASTLEELRDILADPELFSSLDKHFAMFIAGLAQKHNHAAALAAALVSRTTGDGNICLDLTEHAGKALVLNSAEKNTAACFCPSLPDWSEKLLESGVASQSAGNTPLVLAGSNRLYLRRYWEYESSIVGFIRQRTASLHEGLKLSRLAKDLKKLFQPLPAGEIDWQQVAAIAAVTRPFSVISGGPGTGKTSTVAKILALLAGQHNNTGQLRILLAAPTGKAASRLQQAIADHGFQQTGSEPIQATTLHRMLGYIPNSPYFRHNTENPLAADIIVVDEASMVDLPLLAKLMGAVPPSARLILLGDRHQLASVQPGSVLGDICSSEIMSGFSGRFCQLVTELTGMTIASAAPANTKNSSRELQDSFVDLVKSYRFSPESGIALLSTAVREGNASKALDILLATEDGSIAWSEISAPADLETKLLDSLEVSQLGMLPPASGPDFCFSQLDRFRILCALRRGPFGMEKVNNLLEQQFTPQFHDHIGSHISGRMAAFKTDLPCRPVMVTRNDYNLQLFNGDVGFVMPNPEDPQTLRAFFREEQGKLRSIAPPLLPAHETVFAMTVHKSQGSEFNRVLLILPDQDSPLLTRELLYTAITRARHKVEIWGSRAIFASAVKRQIKRTSGLTEALWGGDI